MINYMKNSKKLIAEKNPNKFIYTETIEKERITYKRIYLYKRKITKLPVSWDSNFPKIYKRNITHTEFYRVKTLYQLLTENYF